jgi:hypothetical protein
MRISLLMLIDTLGDLVGEGEGRLVREMLEVGVISGNGELVGESDGEEVGVGDRTGRAVRVLCAVGVVVLHAPYPRWQP